MPNSKVTKTLQKGLALAAGLIFANVVVMPMISTRTPSAGFFIGVTAGFITLVIYAFIAIAQSRNDAK